MKNKIITIFILMIFLFSLSGCGCKVNPPQYKMKLEIWGVNDSPDNYEDIFANYIENNYVVTDIQFRKFPAETYKKELMEALAAGKGPDIFMINSTWTPAFWDKIVPAPTEILSEKSFRDNFVDVAADDFINEGKVQAVPLAVDSLALFYNKDLLNAAGITRPPTTWDELEITARKLTKIDANGNVLQSGIAMGTAYNINRSVDIFSLLMMQNGIMMTGENGVELVFNKNTTNDSQMITPNEKALDFYTQFARVGSPNYMWNSSLDYSIDAFAEGNLAMMFNYSYNLATIKSKSPKLNFTVAPVPQYTNTSKVSLANFFGYVVSLNKKATIDESGEKVVPITDEIRIAETWKFLKYLTTKPELATNSGSKTVDPSQAFDAAKNYLEKVKKPAARKDLIDTQKGIYELGVFAQQNLIAKNWKHTNVESIEVIIAEMIDQINKGKSNVRDALKIMVERSNQLNSEQ